MRNPHKRIKFSSKISHLNLSRSQEPSPAAPFALDLVNECLRRGEQVLPLTRKAFAVLRYLVEHPGRLVTKQELLDAVWSQTYVSEGVLTNCILRLREALEDQARSPRFIETMHGRGYRLMTPLATTPLRSLESSVLRRASENQSPSSSAVQILDPRGQTLDTPLVGRTTELERLHKWLDKAMRGERQLVFVTGEPGIGKTTVVEAFLEQIAAEGKAWIGRGQCIEHHGAGEAYMPVLEALGRLGREPGGERLVALLSHYAPTWLVQMPALLGATELEALQRRVQGVRRERMLREMAEALEAVTTEKPLVLMLEDLHWSDVSTLDLLAVLARRRERSRLLVIGTYRPVEMLGHEHPLRAVMQELQLHRQCEELRLGVLTEKDVSEYLAVRFAESVLPAGLARVIHQRTSGNPLFMVNVGEDLIAQRGLVEVEGRWVLKAAVEALERGVPESLQQMIERQIGRLSAEEQHVLEVASVAGVEFSAAAVAIGVEATAEGIEAICAGLARRGHFMRAQGVSEWPDGTVTARYGFSHALYQSVLYERVPAGRRIGLHRRIGEREEAAYGERAREVAAELAMHFERGRDYRRAVQYLQQAGENAIQRSAHVEAISLLTKGLELLKTLPDMPERIQQELRLQIALGAPLMTTKGYAVPEAEHAYARARELCRQLGDTSQLFRVLVGLEILHLTRGEFQLARELGEQLLRLAQSVQDPALLVPAQNLLGQTLYFLGELGLAREHVEQGVSVYDPAKHHALVLYATDHGAMCYCFAAYVLWQLGYPDQALKRIYEALALAQKLSHPFTLAFVLSCVAYTHGFRREGQLMQERAAATIAVSTEHGFPYFLAWAAMMHGCALTVQGQGEEGIAEIRQGLATLQATGAMQVRPSHLVLLVEAYEKMGRAEEGLTVLTEAWDLKQKTGERIVDAELYRLKGELTLQKAGTVGGAHPTREAEAERCFCKAIEIAQRQQAKSLELRAVMGLSRLWQRQGKKKKARRMLAGIYGWFTEGFDTADLKEAKALLEKLDTP